MNLQANGNFHVTPGEVVTVAVTAVNTMYLAIFSDLLISDWQIVEPPHPVTPREVREVRRFTAALTAPSREAFALLFDFVRNPGSPVPAGAQYVVQLQGTVGPPVGFPVPPIGPFPIDQQFVFEVRQ